LVRIATSISSPAATFCSTTPAVAYSILSLCPEAASKAGASSCRTARIAPALSTFSSAALASAAITPAARASVPASNRMLRIIATPLKVHNAPGVPVVGISPTTPALKGYTP
jgi:hypothetical protein